MSDAAIQEPGPASPRANDATADAPLKQEDDATQPAAAEPSTATMTDAPMGLDGAGDDDNADAPAADAPAPEEGDAEAEARIPQKKDATLREFLGKMDDYAPVIPDAVVNHYLTLAGLPPPPATPPALARLLALATQKFVSDIAADSYQYARIRTSHTTSNTANANLGATLGLPGQAPGVTPAGGASKDAGGKANLGLGTQRPGFGGGGGQGGQGRTVLTMEDLGMAVGEYGVNVKRGEFYR